MYARADVRHRHITRSCPKRREIVQLSTAIRQRRPRIRFACDLCHSKKLKCNGELPCQKCAAKAMPCTYRRDTRRGPSLQAPWLPTNIEPKLNVETRPAAAEGSSAADGADVAHATGVDLLQTEEASALETPARTSGIQWNDASNMLADNPFSSSALTWRQDQTCLPLPIDGTSVGTGLSPIVQDQSIFDVRDKPGRGASSVISPLTDSSIVLRHGRCRVGIFDGARFRPFLGLDVSSRGH